MRPASAAGAGRLTSKVAQKSETGRKGKSVSCRRVARAGNWLRRLRIPHVPGRKPESIRVTDGFVCRVGGGAVCRAGVVSCGRETMVGGVSCDARRHFAAGGDSYSGRLRLRRFWSSKIPTRFLFSHAADGFARSCRRTGPACEEAWEILTKPLVVAGTLKSGIGHLTYESTG